MKRIVLKIAILVAAIGFTLAMIEFFIRKYYPQVTFNAAQAFSFNCFSEGEHRWLKLASNKTCTLRSNVGAFPDVEVKTNSNGLRNPEITKEKPATTKRVLFIGDSFTMGWGVPEDKAYPRLAEELARQMAPTTNLEFINAGFTGAGPSGYYLFLKYFGLEFKPDAIVIGTYVGNDITARRDIEWTKTDATGLPEVVRSKSSYIDSQGNIRYKNTPFKYKIPLLRNSHLFVYLVDHLIPQSLTLPDHLKTSYLLCLFKPNCTEQDTAKAEVKRLFAGMKRLADDAGIPILVVLIPAEFQVNENMRLKYDIRVPLTPNDQRRPNEELMGWFKENGIPSLDLLPVFQNNNDLMLYFEQDDHFNPLGHALAATAIAPAVLQLLSQPTP